MPADNARFDGVLIGERYRLGPAIGRGGQGTTYVALDVVTGDRVAVKAFDLSKVENWKEFELFQRECRVLQELDHPGIPDYLDEVEDSDEGKFYLVMEYVPGRALGDVLRRDGAFAEQAVWSVLLQVVDILAHLHARVPPVIHRDIKPSNLIRRPDGQLVLVDFGAVRDAFRPDGGSTVVGTFGYMAPEQLHGQATPETDLYALGATLLYLATGIEPEKLPRKGLRIKVKEALDGSLRDLSSLLTRMTEPELEKRPTSAVALREELASGLIQHPDDDADPEPPSLPAPPAPPPMPVDMPWPIAMAVSMVLFVVSLAGRVALGSAEYVFIPLVFAILLAFNNSEKTKRELKVRERSFKRNTRAARESLLKATRRSRQQLRAAHRWGRSDERRRRRLDSDASARSRARTEYNRRVRAQRRHRRRAQDHRHHWWR